MMRFWNTTREWEGETAAVMASGPSMTYELSDKICALGIRAIAVNNQGIEVDGVSAMAPWADILYAADNLWWMHNAEKALAFKGRKVTIVPTSGAVRTQGEEILVMRNGGTTGFDSRTDHLRTGGNGGYQAVHLAAHLGAKRILMFGFDMHSKGGEHWFGFHSWRVGHKGNYDMFRARFDTLAPELLRRGIEVVNCTPGSALKCFPIMTLEEAIKDGVPNVHEDSRDDGRENAGTARAARACNEATQVGAS